MEELIKAILGAAGVEAEPAEPNRFVERVNALVDEVFPNGVGPENRDDAADFCEALMIGISTITIATACAVARQKGENIHSAMVRAKGLSRTNMHTLDELTANHAMNLIMHLSEQQAAGRFQ